jgi:hypothetical protein
MVQQRFGDNLVEIEKKLNNFKHVCDMLLLGQGTRSIYFSNFGFKQLSIFNISFSKSAIVFANASRIFVQFFSNLRIKSSIIIELNHQLIFNKIGFFSGK